jgi:hypothetical protein
MARIGLSIDYYSITQKYEQFMYETDAEKKILPRVLSG